MRSRTPLVFSLLLFGCPRRKPHDQLRDSSANFQANVVDAGEDSRDVAQLTDPSRSDTQSEASPTRSFTHFATGSCRVERPATRLAEWTTGSTIDSVNGNAVLVSNWEKQADESLCDRDPSACMGDWQGHDYNPYTMGWTLGAGPSGEVREFRPAHTEYDPECSAAGCTNHDDFAVAVTRGTERLVYGVMHRGTFSTAKVFLGDLQGNTIASARLVPRDVADPEDNSPGWPFMIDKNRFAAAGNSNIVLALHWGVTSPPPDPEADYSCGADGGRMDLQCGTHYGFTTYVATGSRLRREVIQDHVADGQLVGPALRATYPDAIDVVLGEDYGAAVYRVDHSLFLLRFTRLGALRGAPTLLYASPNDERPGAPSVALFGPQINVVFAVRAARSAPYVLQELLMNHEQQTPPPAHPLATGTASAFAPSLSIQDGAVALAWMEGGPRTGRIFAGVGGTSMQGAIANKVEVAPGARNARDPEITWSDGRAWVTWMDVPTSSSTGLISAVGYVTSMVCDGSH